MAFSNFYKGEKKTKATDFPEGVEKQKKFTAIPPTCISDILINVQLGYKCRHSVHVQTGLLDVLQVHVLDLFASLKQLVHSHAVIRRRSCGNFLLFLDS